MKMEPANPRPQQLSAPAGNFYTRVRHLASVTDPRLAFASTSRLFEARDLVLAQRYVSYNLLCSTFRSGAVPPNSTAAQLAEANRLYQSAFHPDNGELQHLLGRMSFFVYGSTFMCGGMLLFHHTRAGVVFWQWANQSYNAWVNYTNRNAKSELTNRYRTQIFNYISV